MGKGRKQPHGGRGPGPAAKPVAARPSASAAAVPRVLVVTAYYKEERGLIERTLRSVAAQTARLSGRAVVDHMLVADGFPQDWIDGTGVRHIRLDRAHGDYGNTPRGVGAQLAIAEGYDAISFCDADNWYEPDHVACCLDGAAKGGEAIDYVIARRIMRRPDETAIPIADEPVTTHVDTNCFFFLPGSYGWLHHFANTPRELSIIGDRLFFGVLKTARAKAVLLSRPTVNYHCLWDPIYRAIGEVPPPGSKPAADHGSAERWLAGLSNREREIASRLTGLPLQRPAGAAEPPPAPRPPPRVLAITAYYKEERGLIEACLASVAAQTATARGLATVDHMLVGDGFPQDWIDETGARHLRLDQAHGDYGNTPRGVASLLAISEGYDAFFYLDADNSLDPDHVEACLATAASVPDCDWVMARRHLCRPDGTAMPFALDDCDVDTNCFFFLRGSHHLVHHFAGVPRAMSGIGDRLFHLMLTAQPLAHAMVPHRTVRYLCLWREPYELAGEEPPPEAKPPIDQLAIRVWYDALPARRREVVTRLIGAAFG